MGTQSTWGQHSYCVSTKTHYTYTQNMLRFVIGALLLSTTVLGAVQPRVQPNARQFEPQQSEFGEWKTVEPQQTEFGEWKIEPQQTEFGEWKVVSQGDNVQGREEFGANVDLTTPLGGAGINAKVGLPAPANNLLTTAVIGLGVSSLVNTVATVVIPFFKTDEAPATVKCVLSEWSECKAANLLDCGPGTQNRTVVTPASNGGQECPKLTKDCSLKSCPVKCVLSEWSECKTEDSRDCGPGTQTKTVLTPASNGGEECSSQRTQSCEMSKKCPVNCAVSDWSECIAVNSWDCGPGTKTKTVPGTKTRTVTTSASHEGKKCPQLSKSCEMTKNCPVKCVVSDWSECKTGNLLDCGPGTKTRTVITQANYGGLECPSLTQSCEMSKKCPVNCAVSEWSECKTEDSRDCGTGTQTRTLITPALYGGLECPSLTQSCEMSKKCPDDGNDNKDTEQRDDANEAGARGFGASSFSWYPMVPK